MKKTAICIFLLVFLLLSLETAGLEVTRINIRFALMVRDMADCGLRLFPTMNGGEYGDYPSLWILLSRLASLNGRFLNLWTLSLPSLLLGAYTVAVTYCSGEMRGKGRGIIVAALLLTAPQFVDLMSEFGLDVPVMACGATMLYLLQTERSERRLCIAFAALFCISFCVRGPMGSAVFSVACGGACGGAALLRTLVLRGSVRWRRRVVELVSDVSDRESVRRICGAFKSGQCFFLVCAADVSVSGCVPVPARFRGACDGAPACRARETGLCGENTAGGKARASQISCADC